MSTALFNSNKPGAKDSDTESGIQDAPTPISSAGSPTQPYSNASGEFDLKKELRRKVKSRSDLGKMSGEKPDLPDVSQPEYGEGPLNTGGTQQDDATSRYFGNFSIEAKRNVFDLLKNHPEFDEKSNIRMNRIQNNTQEVMPHDETRTVENGGYLIRHDLPQASQKTYGTKNR
jgi:hypothetical protein